MTEKINRGMTDYIQVYQMMEYPATVESSAQKADPDIHLVQPCAHNN